CDSLPLPVRRRPGAPVDGAGPRRASAVARRGAEAGGGGGPGVGAPGSRRGTEGGPSAQAGAPLAWVRPLPSADGAPIDAETLGHDMHGDVTLEQGDRAESSLLEFNRAPLWAHAVPPTGEHSRLGHYLGSYH